MRDLLWKARTVATGRRQDSSGRVGLRTKTAQNGTISHVDSRPSVIRQRDGHPFAMDERLLPARSP